ncbi:hypothetical protein [Thermofilum sp.]|nr:hypothetical protein [Thermofilum sp.]
MLSPEARRYIPVDAKNPPHVNMMGVPASTVQQIGGNNAKLLS